MMKKIVVVPRSKDSRKKSWRKLLESVDVTKDNGFAFVGSWLRAGEKAELDIGSFVLCYDEDGSIKNWYPSIELLRVTVEGLEQVYEYIGSTRERSWALGCRDDIKKAIAGLELSEAVEGLSNPLAAFKDEDILAEVTRRGYEVRGAE
jgi:hypothetical protein